MNVRAAPPDDRRARGDGAAEGPRLRHPLLGRRQVLAQPRTAYPSSEKRFGLRPTVAARSMWARIDKLHEDRVWLERYEDAKARFRAGNPGVSFPFGTWKLRVYCRVACDDPPVGCSLAA